MKSSTCVARPAIRSRRRCSPSWRGSGATAARRSCSSTAAASCPPSTAVRAARRAAARAATSRCRCTPTAGSAATTAATRRPSRRCPACGSAELARIGAGTQRLERELEKHVPELERIRLDADTAASRGTSRPRSSASRRRPRVLVGTQMVAKGHHFAGVALAAVVDADTGLGDAGLPRRGADVPARHPARGPQRPRRAGPRDRADVPARRARRAFAARHDVAGFLAEELARRRELGYPPFRHLVASSSRARRRRRRRAAQELKHGLEPDAELLGPAPLLRLRGRHRAQLVAKTTSRGALASRGRPAARRRRAGDAARGPDGRRRRRPAVALVRRSQVVWRERPTAPLHSRHGGRAAGSRKTTATRCRTSESSTRRTTHAVGSPSRRFASIPTRCCGCGPPG